MPARAFEGSDSALQARQLESLRVPFVYRKYFDFDALAALRCASASARTGSAAPARATASTAPTTSSWATAASARSNSWSSWPS